jgi:hypothetical protein
MELDNHWCAVRGEISAEVGTMSLAYLLLAKKLLDQDREATMLHLGIESEMADLLSNMSGMQIAKLAKHSFCRAVLGATPSRRADLA